MRIGNDYIRNSSEAVNFLKIVLVFNSPPSRFWQEAWLFFRVFENCGVALGQSDFQRGEFIAFHFFLFAVGVV